MRRYCIISRPNNSKPIIMEAIGAFVTPQKSEIIPTAAQSEGGKPTREPNKQPNVAPIVKDGTISPPLNPAPSVTAVKIIFQRKADFGACPAIASSIRLAPAPLYAFVPKRYVSAMIIKLATTIRT